MQRVELEVKSRDLGEKNVTRSVAQLRLEGWIPATIYGQGNPASIAVNYRTIEKAIHSSKAGHNALFTIKAPGETSVAVIKEIQRDVLRHNAIHIDFQRIDLKKKLELAVPTHTVGEATGVKNSGGVLEHITREVRVKCLPDDIPSSIDIDVTALEVGHGVKVKDLPQLNGVEYLTLPETIVVNVVAPKVEEVKPATPAEAAAAAAAGEPEVIAKGKKDEEGAPAAGGKAAPAAAGGKGGAAAVPAKKDEKKK